jgi:hypothetical protein
MKKRQKIKMRMRPGMHTGCASMLDADTADATKYTKQQSELGTLGEELSVWTDQLWGEGKNLRSTVRV